MPLLIILQIQATKNCQNEVFGQFWGFLTTLSCWGWHLEKAICKKKIELTPTLSEEGVEQPNSPSWENPYPPPVFPLCAVCSVHCGQFREVRGGVSFFKLWTVFWAIFRYPSGKILTLILRSQKCLFPKCTFSGPQLSRRGLVWYLLNS